MRDVIKVSFKEHKDIRKGKSLLWKMETKHSIVQGHTIDNLDTKTYEEAESRYEKMFVVIRDVLSDNESSCMDNEYERLNCTQQIADTLRAKGFLSV